LNILQVHNFYQQPGGEDQVYAAEFDLLTRHGHAVRQYLAHNSEVRQMHGLELAWRTIWNSRTYGEAREIIRQFRPDVVHCHNTFPIISPAIYYAARREAVPVVQTLHNYRLICPAATLYRDGHVCQDCVPHLVPYDAVLHRCYRNHRAGSAVVASMLAVHRFAKTWTKQVSTYIALTEFARSKLVEGGLPPEKIVVKPNFLVDDPGVGDGSGSFALFVGRLSEEKGLKTLLKAWREVRDIRLKIVGDGPLADFVKAEAKELPNVSVLGYCDRTRVIEYMQSAAFVVMPSEWYEGFPMTAVEAMACGTPVLASDLGSLRELISEGINGAKFAVGDPYELARAARELLTKTTSSGDLRKRTRLRYEEQYTPKRNYNLLMEIYGEQRTGPPEAPGNSNATGNEF
jgi:glycosyltransferase involved in cell wall biosynthesis